MPDSENHLYRPFRDGDEGAFTELIRTSGKKVQKYLLSKLSRQDAEDVYQKVVTKAWFNRASFEVDRPFIFWLFGIAKNELKAFLRKTAYREHKSSTDPEDLPAQRAIVYAPEDVEWAGLDWECLNWLLQHSNASERAFIRLLWEGLTNEEIARAINISIDVVKKRKAKLQSKLKPYTREMRTKP